MIKKDSSQCEKFKKTSVHGQLYYVAKYSLNSCYQMIKTIEYANID